MLSPKGGKSTKLVESASLIREETVYIVWHRTKVELLPVYPVVEAKLAWFSETLCCPSKQAPIVVKKLESQERIWLISRCNWIQMAMAAQNRKVSQTNQQARPYLYRQGPFNWDWPPDLAPSAGGTDL